PELGEQLATAVRIRLVPEGHVAVHERGELARGRWRRLAELVVSANAAIRAQNQHVHASRGHLATACRHHLPDELYDVVMGGEPLARSEDKALIPHPFHVGACHTGVDGLVASGVELAVAGGAVRRPERGDTPLARFGIRLVPYRDVAIDEFRDLAHTVAPLIT